MDKYWRMRSLSNHWVEKTPIYTERRRRKEKHRVWRRETQTHSHSEKVSWGENTKVFTGLISYTSCREKEREREARIKWQLTFHVTTVPSLPRKCPLVHLLNCHSFVSFEFHFSPVSSEPSPSCLFVYLKADCSIHLHFLCCIRASDSASGGEWWLASHMKPTKWTNCFMSFDLQWGEWKVEQQRSVMHSATHECPCVRVVYSTKLSQLLLTVFLFSSLLLLLLSMAVVVSVIWIETICLRKVKSSKLDRIFKETQHLHFNRSKETQ